MSNYVVPCYMTSKLHIMERKQYCKSLIGKRVMDKCMPGRIGILTAIRFHSKDFSVCWFAFKWEGGCYMRSILDIEAIESTPVQMRLFE